MRKKNRKGNRDAQFLPVSFDAFQKLMREGRIAMPPLRHEALSPTVLERARRLFPRVGQFICRTFEQWELGFLRDVLPEAEIAVWEAIADAFDAYRIERADAGGDVVRTLIKISMGWEPDVETRESQRLRELLIRFYGRNETIALWRKHKAVNVMVVGVADCHGMESCRLKSDCFGPDYYQLRAALNRQRHAVAYLAEIPANHVATIDDLLAARKKVEALTSLRTHAVQIRLASIGSPEEPMREKTSVEESWKKIPDSSLDPWSQRRVTAEIRRTHTIKMPLSLKMGDQKLTIDGCRRLRGYERQGGDKVDMYVVKQDDSQDRWPLFDVVVKSADPPIPEGSQVG